MELKNINFLLKITHKIDPYQEITTKVLSSAIIVDKTSKTTLENKDNQSTRRNTGFLAGTTTRQTNHLPLPANKGQNTPMLSLATSITNHQISNQPTTT